MFKFENPERQGAESLKKAGYVEFDKMRPTVVGKVNAGREPIGYFCANCEYYQTKDEALKGGFCSKLNAEVAVWGCCNHWNYKAMDTAQTQNQQSDDVQEPPENTQKKISPVQPQQKAISAQTQAKAGVPGKSIKQQALQNTNKHQSNASLKMEESTKIILKRIIREEIRKIIGNK